MNNLLSFIEHYQAPSTVIIILSLTLIIWKIFSKMTSAAEVDISFEMAIIRGLIIARGRSGATLKQIKSEFALTSSVILQWNHLLYFR